MPREGLRRLDLWLPDTHPIFHVPPRQRAAKAREWLDLAMRLDDHLRALREAVEALRAALEGGGRVLSSESDGVQRGRKFLEAFEEWQGSER